MSTGVLCVYVMSSIKELEQNNKLLNTDAILSFISFANQFVSSFGQFVCPFVYFLLVLFSVVSTHAIDHLQELISKIQNALL